MSWYKHTYLVNDADTVAVSRSCDLLQMVDAACIVSVQSMELGRLFDL